MAERGLFQGLIQVGKGWQQGLVGAAIVPIEWRVPLIHLIDAFFIVVRYCFTTTTDWTQGAIPADFPWNAVTRIQEKVNETVRDMSGYMNYITNLVGRGVSPYYYWLPAANAANRLWVIYPLYQGVQLSALPGLTHLPTFLCSEVTVKAEFAALATVIGAAGAGTQTLTAIDAKLYYRPLEGIDRSKIKIESVLSEFEIQSPDTEITAVNTNFMDFNGKDLRRGNLTTRLFGVTRMATGYPRSDALLTELRVKKNRKDVFDEIDYHTLRGINQSDYGGFDLMELDARFAANSPYCPMWPVGSFCIDFDTDGDLASLIATTMADTFRLQYTNAAPTNSLGRIVLVQQALEPAPWK